MNKIYTSKKGLKFSISAISKPKQADVIFFTPNEFEWIKQQNLSPDEFEFLWKAKSEDFRAPIIPEKDQTDAQRLAKEYGDKIIAMFKGGLNVEQEKK